MTIKEGLKIIDKYNLPHPEWEFVFTSKDLDNFYQTEDYVGWTIRTVEIIDGPWINLYANWLEKKDVPAKVDELQNQHENKALFVVYPSWKWKKGGTILIEPDRTVIESVDGPIVDLMRHGKVTASYFFENDKLVDTTGDKNFLTEQEIKIILQAQNIPMKNIILEWGITTEGKFIFYRIEDLAEAARLLIEKYS
jgi:hypothetical protein